jgi:hypothetical protein
LYVGILVLVSLWAGISAVGLAGSVRMEAKGFALGFAVSFVLSALAAAYCFWRLLGGEA